MRPKRDALTPLSGICRSLVTHSRFFSATRGLAASDEFFLKVEPSSVAKVRFPFQLIENLLEWRRLKDLSPVRKYGVRNHNDERQLNDCTPGGDL
jgi:hypothetical protein